MNVANRRREGPRRGVSHTGLGQRRVNRSGHEVGWPLVRT